MYFPIPNKLHGALQQCYDTAISRCSVQRLTARFVPVQDTVPDVLRCLGKPEQIPILRIDGAFIDKEIHVDRPTPIGLAYQHDGDWLDFAGLHQSQNLEQFVERAIASRERNQCLGSEEKMQLAQCEIMKAETEFGRDVGIRILLMR